MSKALIGAAIIFIALACVAARADEEKYASVTLDNQSNATLTMNIDGVYGCTADAASKCTSAPVKVGKRDLYAASSNNEKTYEKKQENIPEDGYTWLIK